jgi:hypothetical protein
MAKNIEVTLTLNTKKFKGQLANAQRQMQGFGGSANVAKGSIIGLAARFAPLAAAAVGVTAAFKGLSASVGAARQIQDIGVVLKNIVGDAEGGALALQQVRDIATELPFAFEEIAGATPALATVSQNLKELEDNTRLAADIAAVTGLSFQDASSQLQRAFSAGAGAADMFREKGVLSMAGFQAGASYSIDETRKKLREFGTTIAGAANDLNITLTGSLSQAGDRFFQFRSAVGDAIVPEFTAFINRMVDIFDNNKETITAFAKTLGESVVNAFYSILEVGAVVVDYFSMLFSALKSIAQFVNDKFGDVIYTVFNAAAKVIGGVVEAVAFLGKGIGKLIELAGGSADVTQFFDNIQNAANKVRTEGLDKFGEALDDMFNAVPVTTAQDFVAALIEDLRAAGQVADEEAERIKEILANTEEAGKTQIQAAANSFTESLADYKSASEELLSTFSSATQKLSDDLATALVDGQDAMGAFKDFFKTIVKEIIAQALRLAIIQPILSSIFGAFGYNIGFTGAGGIESITKRQMGGPIMKNKPYLVGEAGPELIVPSGGGSVISNSSLAGMGGGTAVTYNINAVDARSFKQLVAEDPEFIYGVTRLGQRRLPA